jgi:hypothetical protein
MWRNHQLYIKLKHEEIYNIPADIFTSCTEGKTVYFGSTPANSIVKTFLGIPLSDSVDFIRWKLITGGNQYSLQCDYGISKPNANGFINTKTIDIHGKLIREGNYHQLHHNIKRFCWLH